MVSQALAICGCRICCAQEEAGGGRNWGTHSSLRDSWVPLPKTSLTVSVIFSVTVMVAAGGSDPASGSLFEYDASEEYRENQDFYSYRGLVRQGHQSEAELLLDGAVLASQEKRFVEWGLSVLGIASVSSINASTLVTGASSHFEGPIAPPTSNFSGYSGFFVSPSHHIFCTLYCIE